MIHLLSTLFKLRKSLTKLIYISSNSKKADFSTKLSSNFVVFTTEGNTSFYTNDNIFITYISKLIKIIINIHIIFYLLNK